VVVNLSDWFRTVRVETRVNGPLMSRIICIGGNGPRIRQRISLDVLYLGWYLHFDISYSVDEPRSGIQH
jgi:hypothetical protein